jgi:hypothetical protein
MSIRSRAAANLAWFLNDKLPVEARVSWDNPSGRPRDGAWVVRWTDGPTVDTVRSHAADLVRYCRPLTIDVLRFSRFTTGQAWAAAMLALHLRGELPERPALGKLEAEVELWSTDVADWTHLWAHAGQLVEQAGQDIYEVVTLIHATVTKPRNETPVPAQAGVCAHCAATLTPTGTGRPGRYCGPACRQAAHRARRDVTKPRNETTCATRGATITPRGAARPARHCSPACRSRAWRRANGQPR